MVAGTLSMGETATRKKVAEESPALREVDTETHVQELLESAENFALRGYDADVLSMRERPGFKAFVSANKEALKGLAALRDEQQVIAHLREHGVLLEGIAHARAWFFDRHLAAMKTGRREMEETVQDEAAALFLLDWAVEAARAAFAETQNVKRAARRGVDMLAEGLSAKGDPVGTRENLGLRVQLWLGLIKQAAAATTKPKLQAKSKQQLKSSKQQQPPQAQAQAQAQPSGSQHDAGFSSSTSASLVPVTAEPSVEDGSGSARKEQHEQDGGGGLSGFLKGWLGS